MSAGAGRMPTEPNCELCRTPGGRVLWRDELCRAVAVEEPGYPGFCRVVLNRHAAEMTDLTLNERERLMRTVFALEAALRDVMRPDKINLASLGNRVPHVHWHVIPRFADDPHFPDAVWAALRRPAVGRHADAEAIAAALARHLTTA